jgi:hypothetical protein
MHLLVGLRIPLTDRPHHPYQRSLQTSSSRPPSEEVLHHPTGPMKDFCTMLNLDPLLPRTRDRNQMPSTHVPMRMMVRSPGTPRAVPHRRVVRTSPNIGRSTTDSCERKSRRILSQMKSNERFRSPPPPPPPPPLPPPLPPLPPTTRLGAMASSHRTWPTIPCEGVLASQRQCPPPPPPPTSTHYLCKIRESRCLVNRSFRPQDRRLPEDHRPLRPFAQFCLLASTGRLSLRLVDIAHLALHSGGLNRHYIRSGPPQSSLTTLHRLNLRCLLQSTH